MRLCCDRMPLLASHPYTGMAVPLINSIVDLDAQAERSTVPTPVGRPGLLSPGSCISRQVNARAKFESVLGGTHDVTALEARRLVAPGGVAVERETPTVRAEIAKTAEVNRAFPEAKVLLAAHSRRRQLAVGQFRLAVKIEIAELALKRTSSRENGPAK